MHAKAASTTLATRFARNRGIQVTCNIFSSQAWHLAHFQPIFNAKVAANSLPTHFARKSGIHLTSNAFCTQKRYPAHFQHVCTQKRHPHHFQRVLHAKATSTALPTRFAQVARSVADGCATLQPFFLSCDRRAGDTLPGKREISPSDATTIECPLNNHVGYASSYGQKLYARSHKRKVHRVGVSQNLKSP